MFINALLLDNFEFFWDLHFEVTSFDFFDFSLPVDSCSIIGIASLKKSVSASIKTSFPDLPFFVDGLCRLKWGKIKFKLFLFWGHFPCCLFSFYMDPLCQVMHMLLLCFSYYCQHLRDQFLLLYRLFWDLASLWPLLSWLVSINSVTCVKSLGCRERKIGLHESKKPR